MQAHSLVRPVPGPPSDPVLGRVWRLASDDHRDGPRAARLREIERRRPLAPGSDLRCVLLTHRDGHELVLVADRAAHPYAELAVLAGVTPRNAGPEQSGLVAVLGGLCAAVLGQDEVTVVLEEPGIAPTTFRVGPDSTVAAAGPGESFVGIMVADASPEEYLPMLAPRYPVNALAYRASDGTLEVRLLFDDTRIHPGAAGVIASRFGRRPAEWFRLDPAEAAEVLRAGRGSPPTRSVAVTIIDAFAAVADANAERVAVVGADGSLTYRELDVASRVAAGALVERGVRPGEHVGVCLERTPGLIVAILAVLRAGACYVPLDPSHPPARREFVAADAGLALVIDEATLDELAARPAVRELPKAGGDDPAYVIYTSGTTGSPKGVVIPHRNVLALIAATRSEFGLGPSDVWTVFHSPAFDFSVWEVWGGLLTGGRLVVVPYWSARSPAAFARLLREEHVTVLSQTPSAFVNLIPAAVAADGPRDLRLVLFGGEALRTQALAPWLRRFPPAGTRLVNLYGITETTVHVTWHDVTVDDVITGSRSVGRALPGWSISVRSPEGRVLPFDVAGEICVGGAGLAHGYLGRPELTERRFPVDPDAGTRYYRSGDLGRLRADGTLEHLGRLDDQVKIRGYRVELGEIRAALLADPAVRDAVVVFTANDEGGAIGAYVVAAGTTSPTELRRRLWAKLPDYMVPTVLQVVRELPLTPNGKIDLVALPAATATPAAEPQRPESAVHRVWAELFGPETADQDFFDLGGTSLQALKIADALTALGAGEVDPRDVYLNPSVAELIGLLAGRLGP